ncbi:MAG: ribonuclease E/G [Clostridia bacterium]|nr:ribonuclease E/G [Clostridia bacterium]
MSILLIEKTDEGLRSALIRRDRLYAYQSESRVQGIREEQIFLGVVDRNVKGISGAFVRLPGKEFGFLPFSEGESSLSSGLPVVVQVKRPATGNKKALLSRDIALPGAYIVYLPLARGIRVSNRCEAEEKKQLKALAKSLAHGNDGLILRFASLHAEKEQIERELASLESLWQSIQSAASRKSEPCLLWSGESFLTQLLREEEGSLEAILTNDLSTVPAGCSVGAKQCDHPFLLYNVEHKLERSLRRTVRMKSGATLVVDPCEAMTVIDVNSAMAAGGQSISQTAVRINREAAWEVARLLRLRAIGGMILVDFIDMEHDADREAIISEMRAALAEDPVKTTVHDFTVLGILEITRHRAQEPLAALPDLPCPHCGGTGAVLSPLEEDAENA